MNLERVAAGMADVVKAYCDKRFAALTKEVTELRQKIEELEAREKSNRYSGVWQTAEAYERGNMATYDGALWIAVSDAPGKPGVAGWQLAVKRGAAHEARN